MKLNIEKVKSKNLPCLFNDCFENSVLFIEGNPYCKSHSLQLLRDYGEIEELEKAKIIIEGR